MTSRSQECLPRQFSPMVLPFAVIAVLVDLAGLDQLGHHRRQAAGPEIFLAEIVRPPAAC